MRASAASPPSARLARPGGPRAAPAWLRTGGSGRHPRQQRVRRSAPGWVTPATSQRRWVRTPGWMSPPTGTGALPSRDPPSSSIVRPSRSARLAGRPGAESGTAERRALRIGPAGRPLLRIPATNRRRRARRARRRQVEQRASRRQRADQTERRCTPSSGPSDSNPQMTRPDWRTGSTLWPTLADSTIPKARARRRLRLDGRPASGCPLEPRPIPWRVPSTSDAPAAIRSLPRRRRVRGHRGRQGRNGVLVPGLTRRYRLPRCSPPRCLPRRRRLSQCPLPRFQPARHRPRGRPPPHRRQPHRPHPRGLPRRRL